MQDFDENLPSEFGKLLDLEAVILHDTFETINQPSTGVLQDPFIYSIFTEPFVKLFSCKEARFPCYDLVVESADHPLPENSGTHHTDDRNGRMPGNDISATLSLYFISKTVKDALEEDNVPQEKAREMIKMLLQNHKDEEHMMRLSLVCRTRYCHECFKNNENRKYLSPSLAQSFRRKFLRK